VCATEPCEGRRASPSNPNRALAKLTYGSAKEASLCRLVVRCTPAEKAAVADKAHVAGVSVSALLRETLGLISARRRKPVPKADPAVVTALARIGGNVNQIARAVNRAAQSGGGAREALGVAVQLVGIERQLAALLAAHTRKDDAC